MTDGTGAPAEPLRCRATKSDGTPCGVSWGLVDGLCLVHDPTRKAQADAARAAGGTTTGQLAAVKRGAKYRVVTPDQLPTRRPPRTVDDVVRWSSWAGWAVTTGVIDPATCRELNRSLTTLKDALSKRDLLRRIKQLEKLVTQYERERATGPHGLPARSA